VATAAILACRWLCTPQQKCKRNFGMELLGLKLQNEYSKILWCWSNKPQSGLIVFGGVNTRNSKLMLKLGMVHLGQK
jgi:hypothetical protein